MAVPVEVDDLVFQGKIKSRFTFCFEEMLIKNRFISPSFIFNIIVTHVLYSLSVSVKSMGTLISTLFGALVCTVCTGCTVENKSVYVHKSRFHFALL